MVQGLRLAVGGAVGAVLVILLWAAARRGAAASGPREGSYMEHIQELRTRLLWSAVAVLAATGFAFGFRLGPDPAWLPRPALHDTLAAQLYKILAGHIVPEGVQVVALRPTEALGAELTLSIVFGLVAASPVLVGHVVAFFAPALLPREARALRRALIPVVLLFLAGTAFAVAYVAPALLAALYGYADALGAEAMLPVSELVSFVAALALLFGVAFEAPLAMAALTRAGLVQARTWATYWRHATLGILVLTALLTDGTIVTLAMVTLPLVGLYFLGMGAARFGERPKA